MRSTRTFIAVLVACTTTAALAALSSPFQNLADIAKTIGIPAYANAKSAHPVKIAVLDNGFRGYAAEIGKSLPLSTRYHEGPVAVDAATEEAHGLFMAQTIAGLLDRAPGISYELHLYSAFGYSNLEAAISDVIKAKFDVVLYAQVWEYGGNGDGHGFINKLVSQATAAGIVWVNAAGNFADGTYRASIEIGDEDWAKLPGPNDSVRVRCLANSTGKCPLRAVLSWNDFKDDVSLGTEKDLDLILADDTLKILASSAYHQVKAVAADDPGASLYPREIINREVKPGLYLLRVKNRGGGFDAKSDELRLTVSGDNVQLLDGKAGETLLPPADNASVITVGANDSEKSSSSPTLKKPELNVPSQILLTNGEEYRGSSNSSAAAAAAVAVLKSLKPNMTREQIVKRLSSGPAFFLGDKGRGMKLSILGFRNTGERECFESAILPHAPAPLVPFLKNGATAVQTTKGIKIFTQEDPFVLTGILRVSPDDMLIASPTGLEALPRSTQDFTVHGSYEVVQQPLDQTICPATSLGGSGAKLKLPDPHTL